jgi:hypothetical protein
MGIGSYRELARSAAVALTSQNQYENVNVLLLTHIRNAFQIHGVDRIITQRRKGDTEPKPELIETLVGLEGAPWADWAGVDDTAVPHDLRRATSAAC